MAVQTAKQRIGILPETLIGTYGRDSHGASAAAFFITSIRTFMVSRNRDQEAETLRYAGGAVQRCPKDSSFWGTGDDWAALESEALSAEDFSNTAKYLLESGQASM